MNSRTLGQPQSVSLRPAEPDDARDLWIWRNDPQTRAMSRTVDDVPWEGHLAWFERVLQDPQIQLFIGEMGEQKIGMVRFDRGDETEVSINLNPQVRGRGLGRAMLASALERCDGPVLAEIKDENVASRRLFEGLGFVLVGEGGGSRQYRREG